MKKFKKFIAILLTVAMAATFTACGGDGGNEGGNSNEGKALDTDAVITFGLASAWDTLNTYSSNGGSFSGLIADKIFDKLHQTISPSSLKQMLIKVLRGSLSSLAFDNKNY